MAKYQKTSGVSGNWVKAADLKAGIKAKIVSETTAQPSSFTDKNGNPKTQDVAKVRFQGLQDSLNVSINRATLNALIDAYGEDSVAWQGHLLTVETEKVRVAGKNVTALYLIPDGYEKHDDDQGYAVIEKKAIQQDNTAVPQNGAVTEEINVEDIPF